MTLLYVVGFFGLGRMVPYPADRRYVDAPVLNDWLWLMPSSHCRCLPDCRCSGASAGVQGSAGWADGLKEHRIFVLPEHHKSCDWLNGVGPPGTCLQIKQFFDCLNCRGSLRNLSSWLLLPFLCFVQISLPVVVQFGSHFCYVKDFFFIKQSLMWWRSVRFHSVVEFQLFDTVNISSSKLYQGL